MWQRFSNPWADRSAPLTLYHGTSSRDALLALQKGFRPRKRPLNLTDSISVASGYAAIRAWENDEPYGVVLAVTVPSSSLIPDDMAYLFLCFVDHSKFLVTRRQLVATRTCRHADTGDASLAEIGSAVYSGTVPPSAVSVVRKVRAKDHPGYPKDQRAIVRRAHSL